MQFGGGEKSAGSHQLVVKNQSGGWAVVGRNGTKNLTGSLAR